MIKTPQVPDYALLGGSFDPIHRGHLHIALEILRLKAAERVAFLPNGRHNFKQDSVILPFEQRAELIRRAIKPYPELELWNDDATGSGYTDELLQRIFARYPGKAFSFVIGSDNLVNLSRWHNSDWLFRNVSFLIIPRPGSVIDEDRPKGADLRFLHTTPVDISSSMIRERIAQDLPIEDLVPADLAQEIHHLYKQRMNSER